MKYDRRQVPLSSNEPINLMRHFLENRLEVLELGAGSGMLARALSQAGSKVTGIERNEGLIAPARRFFEEVIIADLEEMDFADILKGRSFDAIACGDVLEHITDPSGLIRRLVPLLKEDGVLVASIPNIAHGSIRLALLQGRFDYSSNGGLLDNTHVRFFTRRSIEDLLTTCGLHALSWVHVMRDPLNTEVRVDHADFPPQVLDVVRADPDSFVYQYIVCAGRSPASTSEVMHVTGELLVPPNSELSTDPNEELARLRRELVSARTRIVELTEREENFYEWRRFLRRLPGHLLRRVGRTRRR